jgi:hypothetical protein
VRYFLYFGIEYVAITFWVTWSSLGHVPPELVGLYK